MHPMQTLSSQHHSKLNQTKTVRNRPLLKYVNILYRGNVGLDFRWRSQWAQMLVEVESACPMQLVMSVFYSAGGERKCWLELILLVRIPWGKLQVPWQSMMLAIECLLRNKNSGFQDYSLSIKAVKCNATMTWQRRIQSLCQDQSVLHPGLPHQVARRWNFNLDVSRNLGRIQFYRAQIRHSSSTRSSGDL